MRINFIKYLSYLTRYRSAFMGFAILWIFLCHSGTYNIPIYDSIASIGWMGVDIFIFLSALGLSFSLNNTTSYSMFYKRRLIRIIPTWLLVLFIIHIVGIILSHMMPELPIQYPKNLFQSLLWYTGIGYWFSGILPNPLCCYYEWYIPSLLFLYLISPLLYKRKTYTLILLFVITTVIAYILSYFDIMHSLRLFYRRIPVFILGFIIFKIYFENKEVDIRKSNLLLTIILISFLITTILYYISNDGYLYCRIIPIFLVVPFLLIIGRCIEMTGVEKIFSFFGSISLELYLVHLYKRPNYLVTLMLNDDNLISVAITLLICTIFAYILNIGISYFNKRSPKNIV